MPAFEAYHGRDGAYHQQRFNTLAPNDWRMISLSTYGGHPSPRYAVVWVKEPGPAYVAVHGLKIANYQQWFNDRVAEGYAPVLLSATGSGTNAVVAAVFEKNVKKGWVAKHGLQSGLDTDQSTIEYWCKKARRDGLVLRSGSIYGTSSQRLYIAVWHPQAEAHWSYRTAETAGGHQTWFNAFREVPLRPSFVTLSDFQIYLSTFTDDAVGEWHARHNMTGDQYQSQFNDFKEKGFYPICVQGGGAGSGARYAAIFAKRHTPLPRVWTVRGTGLSTFDGTVKKFMVANGVRAGQLSIAKNGVFKAQRAYTWAHSGYAITEPTHMLRVASLSKMFTCACIQRLYDDNVLEENTRAFNRLGITTKALSSQTVDPRVNDITVEQLVDHEGGWDSGAAGKDYVFMMRTVANALGLAGPPSTFDMARYVYGEPLQFTPGVKSQYSNIGYTTLAALIQRVTNTPYETYLRNTILQPDGITDVRVARILRTQRFPSEGFYDDPNAWWSAAEPNLAKLTAFCHGGEGWTTEGMDGSGGLCASASALVQFIRLHAVWGRGGRMAGAARTGGMAGVSSRAESRGDGVDFAFIFNTRNLPKMPVDDFATSLSSLITATSL
jgi:CubicO group peptidase (beta-lactamase class C family)